MTEKPAPPSREAEIAARLAHAAEKWGDYHGDAEADCRYLLARIEALEADLTAKDCPNNNTGCTCGLDAALKAGR